MADFTKTDLLRIMRAAAGEDEGIDLEGDVLEASFTDLGYDSLAVLEIASRVEREYDVDLDEEAMADVDTPKQLLELVGDRLLVTA